jgi:N-acetylmuramic acid 6-phosphate etherase
MPDELLTEAILEATRDLDRRSAREILGLIHAEDLVAAQAVGRVLGAIERAVEVLVLVLQGGGRWFNVGAGTSGRMGVLDAAEIPPTFGYPADRVQAIQAGGFEAVWRAQEGVEDDTVAAREELRRRELLPGDALVALSASGYTPFTLAALEEASRVGARRIAITCDAHSPLAKQAEVVIAPEVGPEVIAGSTRMKGGLAQKMVLHLLSTTVMVRLGRVEGNQMTNLMPASRKLESRALRMLATLGEIDEQRAGKLLRECHGSVQEALARLRAEPGRGR